MLNESSEVSVKFARTFKRHLRELSKKYQHIRSEKQPMIETIQSGEFPGDRIQGIEYVVFKVRVRNRDAQKGKSSGYRLIYHLKKPGAVLLVEIYSKLDQGDISPNEIRKIIGEEA